MCRRLPKLGKPQTVHVSHLLEAHISSSFVALAVRVLSPASIVPTRCCLRACVRLIQTRPADHTKLRLRTPATVVVLSTCQHAVVVEQSLPQPRRARPWATERSKATAGTSPGPAVPSSPPCARDMGPCKKIDPCLRCRLQALFALVSSFFSIGVPLYVCLRPCPNTSWAGLVVSRGTSYSW